MYKTCAASTEKEHSGDQMLEKGKKFLNVNVNFTFLSWNILTLARNINGLFPDFFFFFLH